MSLGFSIWRVIGLLGLIYVVLMVVVFFTADRLIFRPHHAGYRDTPDVVKLATDDGARISALYLANPAARCTVLFSHGNGEDLGDLQWFLKEYRDKGFSVLAYDYRGYGTSDGKPSERNSYKDIAAAFKYLVETKHVPPDRIIVHGRSVGGGPATYLAAKEKVGGLILESCFVSAYRVMTVVPLLPFDEFKNAKLLPGVKCPVLVIHGTDDRLIPIWHGEKLFSLANEPKQNLWVSGAEHNDVLSVAPEAYWGAIGRLAAALEEWRRSEPGPVQTHAK